MSDFNSCVCVRVCVCVCVRERERERETTCQQPTQQPKPDYVTLERYRAPGMATVPTSVQGVSHPGNRPCPESKGHCAWLYSV